MSLVRIRCSFADDRRQLFQFLLAHRATRFARLSASIFAMHDRQENALLNMRQAVQECRSILSEVEHGLRSIAAGPSDVAVMSPHKNVHSDPAEPPPISRGGADEECAPAVVSLRAAGRIERRRAMLQRRLDALGAEAEQARNQVLASAADVNDDDRAERVAAALRKACDVAEQVGRTRELLRLAERGQADSDSEGTEESDGGLDLDENDQVS